MKEKHRCNHGIRRERHLDLDLIYWRSSNSAILLDGSCRTKVESQHFQGSARNDFLLLGRVKMWPGLVWLRATAIYLHSSLLRTSYSSPEGVLATDHVLVSKFSLPILPPHTMLTLSSWRFSSTYLKILGSLSLHLKFLLLSSSGTGRSSSSEELTQNNLLNYFWFVFTEFVCYTWFTNLTGGHFPS